MTKAKSQSFLKGALILTLATGIVKIIGAIYKIPITGMLTGVGWGYYMAAYNIFNVIYTLSVAGMPIAVSKMVAESVAKGHYKNARKIFRITSVVFIITGFTGFLITFFGAGLFANLIDKSSSYLAIAAISPAILFGCLMSTYRGYYQGLKNMVPTAISQIIEALIKLVAGLLFAYIVIQMGNTQFETTSIVFGIAVENIDQATSVIMPYAAAASILGVSFSTFVGYLFLLFRHKIKGDGITKEQLSLSTKTMPSKSIIKKLLSIAIPICVGAIAFNITGLIDLASINNRLINILNTTPETLVNIVGFEALEKIPEITPNLAELTVRAKEEIANFFYGAYNYSASFFGLIPAITATFGISVLPTITTCWTLNDKKGVKFNIDTLLRMCCLIGLPAGIGMSMLSGPILNFFYAGSPELIIAIPSLAMTAIAAIFLAISTPLYSVLQGIGRADIPVKFMIIGGILKVVINFTLVSIPSINIYGAAVGTIVCYLFIFIASLISLCKITKIKIDINSVFLKPLVAALMCGISGFIFYNLSSKFMPDRVSTIIGIGVGGIFYVVTLFLLRAIKKSDILLLPMGEKIAKLLEKFGYIG